MSIEKIFFMIVSVITPIVILVYFRYLRKKRNQYDDKTAEKIYTALVNGESYLDYIKDLSNDKLKYMILIHSPSPIYEYRQLAFVLIEELERRSI